MITLEKKPVWHITLEMTAREIWLLAEFVKYGLRRQEQDGIDPQIGKVAEDLYDVIKDVKP